MSEERREPEVERIIQQTLWGEAALNARVAALLVDDDGDYVAVNDAACRLTGYTRTELTALRMGGLAADPQSGRIYVNIVRGKQLDGTKSIRTRNGEVVVCRYWAVETRVAASQYFVLLLWPQRHGGY